MDKIREESKMKIKITINKKMYHNPKFNNLINNNKR